MQFANGESPLGEDGGLLEDFVGDGVEENDMLGDRGSGAECLVGAGAVGPAGVDDLSGEAVAGPVGFVGVFDQDGAGADADDIVVTIDDGAGGHGLDLDEVVVIVGVGRFGLCGALCGAGDKGQSEENGGKDFHIVKSIIWPFQLGGWLWSELLMIHQRSSRMVE